MQTAWEPLEGTPTALNALANQLGLDTNAWHFVDVLGLDDEILAVTIPPTARCTALILLYPTTDAEIVAYLKSKQLEEESKSCVFLQQILGGTCGTLAAVHAIANSNPCHTAIAFDSSLSQLIQNNNFDSVQEKSTWFVGLESVRHAHQAAASSMQQGKATTGTISLKGQRQGRHFMTWVHRHGSLWELDGRRNGPVCRGMTTEKKILRDAISIVRELFRVSQDESVHTKISLVAFISTS